MKTFDDSSPDLWFPSEYTILQDDGFSTDAIIGRGKELILAVPEMLEVVRAAKELVHLSTTKHTFIQEINQSFEKLEQTLKELIEKHGR